MNIRKKILSAVLAVMMLAALMPGAYAASTVTISSLEELQSFAAKVNSGNTYAGVTVLLKADISLNGRIIDQNGSLKSGTYTSWTPIGTLSHPFKGVFNGGGHTVTGLYVKNSSVDYQGLFGVVSGATIYNVTVKDSYISAADHAGAIVGYASNHSIISTCHNDNTNVYTSNRSGGIVGWTDYSDVYNCSGDGYCYSGRCSGGIVGDVYSSGKIYNCYSATTVAGSQLVGGISGGTTSADIQNCVMVGKVAAGGYLIAGGDGSRSETNCFALRNSSVNTNLSIGTSSKYNQTFTGYAAKLSGFVSTSGKSYTTALSALNAWVSVRKDGIVYSPWVQTTMYPYLRDGVTSAIKTSYGSEVSQWSSPEMEEAYKDNLIPASLVGEDLTKKIDREEFAAVCVKLYENLSGLTAQPADANTFSDCRDSEVLKAYQLGITAGTSEGVFSPYVLLNREQAAAMLARTFKRVTMSGWTLDTDDQFPLSYTMPKLFADDAQISAFARESVYFMAANKIISGVGGNRFAPKNTTAREAAAGYANATREQAIAISLRMKQNLGS